MYTPTIRNIHSFSYHHNDKVKSLFYTAKY
uniref:Uncharacterized protein n=1 Tax=Arundo donax TaxID=35708 RepID=A0A0A9HFA2_ARUDO